MLCIVTTDDYYGDIMKLIYNLFTRPLKSVGQSILLACLTT